MATKEKSAKKPREKVPTNETKAQRFVRLAKKRVPRAVKSVNSIAAFAGAGYEFTDEQRDKIITALETATANTVAALKRERTSVVEFDL